MRLAFGPTLTVTCLTAGVMSIAMGLVANYPLALAPGMGLKRAISVGIGLFIAFIGFFTAGFVVKPATGPLPVALGSFEGLPIAVSPRPAPPSCPSPSCRRLTFRPSAGWISG